MIIYANSKKDFNGVDIYDHEIDYFVPFTLAYGNKEHTTQIEIEMIEIKDNINFILKYEGIKFNPWTKPSEKQCIGGGGHTGIQKDLENGLLENTKYGYIDGFNIIYYTINSEKHANYGRIKTTISHKPDYNKFNKKFTISTYDFIQDFKAHNIVEELLNGCKTKNNKDNSYIGNTRILYELIYNIGAYSKNPEKLKYIINNECIICECKIKTDVIPKETILTENIIIKDNKIKLLKK